MTAGTGPNLSWVYDRYGNRWQQNVTGGSGSAPQPNLSFNTGKNQITTSGYSYDAAGNMTADPNYTYTYDAEGNIVKVDSGSTAAYVSTARSITGENNVASSSATGGSIQRQRSAGVGMERVNGCSNEGALLLGRDAGGLLHHDGQRRRRWRALRAPGLGGNRADAHQL